MGLKRVHGNTFCGTSPHLLVGYGGSFVSLIRCMGPLSTVPPLILHQFEMERALWAQNGGWDHFLQYLPLSFSFGGCLVDSSGCIGTPSVVPSLTLHWVTKESFVAWVRQAVWAYRCCMNVSAGHSPPTSLITKVSHRGYCMDHWGLGGHIGRVLDPHPFCLRSILKVLTVVIFKMFVFKHCWCKSFCPSFIVLTLKSKYIFSGMYSEA